MVVPSPYVMPPSILPAKNSHSSYLCMYVVDHTHTQTHTQTYGPVRTHFTHGNYNVQGWLVVLVVGVGKGRGKRETETRGGRKREREREKKNAAVGIATESCLSKPFLTFSRHFFDIPINISSNLNFLSLDHNGKSPPVRYKRVPRLPPCLPPRARAPNA